MAAPMLTSAQVAAFERDGLLAVPNFFDAATATRLRDKAVHLAEGMDLTNHPRTVFVTRDDNKHTNDDYFLNSGDCVRYFFEEEAFDSTGKLQVPKAEAVNKIGHALHVLDPDFAEFSLNAHTRGVARSLGFKDPLVLQSMVIFKQPRIGGEVVPHQDSTFLHTEPISAVGLWFALEDCTIHNGCLEFIPGSHKDGLHNGRRFVRKQGAAGLEFTAPSRSYDESAFVPVPVAAGSVVLIHGSVVHRSSANRSDKSRIIYTFHLIEGAPGHVYDELNWLQPTTAVPFSHLYGAPA